MKNTRMANRKKLRADIFKKAMQQRKPFYTLIDISGKERRASDAGL